MADFTRLSVYDGVGDYHLNRFRIVFEPPPGGRSPKTLPGDLIDNFPSYVQSSYATVKFGDDDLDGKKTLQFHGSAAPGMHDDWVVREWVDRDIGFTAQTLKQESGGVGTGVGVAVGVILVAPLAGVLGAVGAGAASTHYNRMHFLAGRRSWRVGPGSDFGVSGNVFVLETVAVERFSANVYRLANVMKDLEAEIPNVWIAMLNNFANKNGLTVVTPSLKPRWQRKARVDYVQLEFDKLGEMLADPEFQDTFRLYPTILPGGNIPWVRRAIQGSAAS